MWGSRDPRWGFSGPARGWIETLGRESFKEKRGMEIYLKTGKKDGVSGLSSGYSFLSFPSPLLSLSLFFLVSSSPFPFCFSLFPSPFAMRISSLSPSGSSSYFLVLCGLPAFSVPRNLHFLLELFTFLFFILWISCFLFARGPHFLSLPLDLGTITSYSFFVPGSLPFLSPWV